MWEKKLLNEVKNVVIVRKKLRKNSFGKNFCMSLYVIIVGVQQLFTEIHCLGTRVNELR